MPETLNGVMGALECYSFPFFLRRGGGGGGGVGGEGLTSSTVAHMGQRGYDIIDGLISLQSSLHH